MTAILTRALTLCHDNSRIKSLPSRPGNTCRTIVCTSMRDVRSHVSDGHSPSNTVTVHYRVVSRLFASDATTARTFPIAENDRSRFEEHREINSFRGTRTYSSKSYVLARRLISDELLRIIKRVLFRWCCFNLYTWTRSGRFEEIERNVNRDTEIRISHELHVSWLLDFLFRECIRLSGKCLSFANVFCTTMHLYTHVKPSLWNVAVFISTEENGSYVIRQNDIKQRNVVRLLFPHKRKETFRTT